jgi:hypothetical protein
MKDVAIATYIDADPNLMIEFNWLYTSWLYSGAWKTSRIVAFYNPKIPSDWLSSFDIDIIPLIPLSETDQFWKDYKFINSIYYLITPEAQELLKYKYVLRTDNDVFLTPYFANFRPRLATFGIGLYALEPIVAAKLVQIAAQWGITPVSNNIGSSLMTSSNNVLLYSELQFEYCKRLAAEEFPDGYGEWPKWFFGVLSMYAGQLAANQLFSTGISLGGLDVHCMSQEEMCSNDYHIHAWHTNNHFSNFRWRNGEYKDINPKTLNKNIISDYCLWIALEAEKSYS